MACRGCVKFFLDNNISPKVARALNHLLAPDHSAHHLKDEYAPSTPDEVWMSDLGKKAGWVIISGDSAISRNPHEVKAWKEAGHPIFFLKPAWMYLGGWEQASKLFHRFPEILKLAAKAKPGDAFLVPVKGEKIGTIDL
jgi:PIN like domain